MQTTNFQLGSSPLRPANSAFSLSSSRKSTCLYALSMYGLERKLHPLTSRYKIEFGECGMHLVYPQQFVANCQHKSVVCRSLGGGDYG